MEEMDYRDFLAVAATKPTLYAGVPIKLLMGNISLSVLPGIYLNHIFFEGKNALVFLGTWALIFFVVHKTAVFFTRRDNNFMSVLYTNFTMITTKKGASYWKGYNSYRV